MFPVSSIPRFLVLTRSCCLVCMYVSKVDDLFCVSLFFSSGFILDDFDLVRLSSLCQRVFITGPALSLRERAESRR
jgi:hypothetical protein